MSARLSRLTQLIDDYGLGTPGGWPEDVVAGAERQLGIALPDQYRWFQTHYDISELKNGDRILNVTPAEREGSIVDENEHRGLSATRLLFYIGDCFRGYLVDDNSSWEVIVVEDGVEEKYAADFVQFLERRLPEIGYRKI